MLLPAFATHAMFRWALSVLLFVVCLMSHPGESLFLLPQRRKSYPSPKTFGNSFQFIVTRSDYRGTWKQHSKNGYPYDAHRCGGRRYPTFSSLVSHYYYSAATTTSSLSLVSSGFSFDDGEQILVSVQKPLGVILEQDTERRNSDGSVNPGMIIVSDVDNNGSAARAGVQIGDVLLAVQNASVEGNVDLDQVLEFIRNGPRVINLRLLRKRR